MAWVWEPSRSLHRSFNCKKNNSKDPDPYFRIFFTLSHYHSSFDKKKKKKKSDSILHYVFPPFPF